MVVWSRVSSGAVSVWQTKEEPPEDDAAAEAEAAARADPVGSKSLAELEAAEDDGEFADDRALEALRRKRMMELRAAAAKNRFGSVLPLDRQDYVREVTEDSKKGFFVVVHLFAEDSAICREVDACLAIVASRHKSTKFMRCLGNQIIPDYPDHNCPTLLVYHEGDCKRRLVGPAQVVPAKGARPTPATLAAVLVEAGALSPEEVEDALDGSAVAAARGRLIGSALGVDGDDGDDIGDD